MADSSDTLRTEIQNLIKTSGLKQIWIAEQLGVSQKHLSQMLRGTVAMTLDWAQRIAKACGHEVTVTVTPVARCDGCHARQPKALPDKEPRIVAYRSALPGALSVYCTRHTDELGYGVMPLTSDDLPDGGICAYPECGTDVLIPQNTKETDRG